MPEKGRQVVRWHVHVDAEGVVAAARDHILAAARNAIAKRNAFRIALSGGETPRRLYERLASADAEWPAWHIYFGDERCLPAGDAQRNSVMAERAWLAASAIPASQIHPIPADLGAEAAAAAYSRELEQVGDFDLVLLGLGEDGHTASLFPGREWGTKLGTPAAIPVHDAPKPLPDRVSLSAWRLSLARSVLVLVAGEGKREAVKRWRAGEDLPVAAIVPAAAIDVFADRVALARE